VALGLESVGGCGEWKASGSFTAFRMTASAAAGALNIADTKRNRTGIELGLATSYERMRLYKQATLTVNLFGRLGREYHGEDDDDGL
jgi:hypothetical protein